MRKHINLGQNDITGECCGVRLNWMPGVASPLPLLILLIEDDSNWFLTDYNISAYWIDDLIKVLQKTKSAIKNEFNK